MAELLARDPPPPLPDRVVVVDGSMDPAESIDSHDSTTPDP